LYLFSAVLAIGIPAFIAQEYLSTATGKLTRLENIGQIQKQPPTKYYTLTKYYVDKAHPGIHPKVTISGKHNQDFNMYLYFVLPILTSPADTASGNCLAWYGIKYQKRISTPGDKQERMAAYEAFARESQEDFDQQDVGQFVYLIRLGNTDDRKGYAAAIKSSQPDNANASTTILLPVNEPFDNRNGHKLAWIFGSLAIGATFWLLMVLIPRLDEDEVQQSKSGKETRSGDAKDVLSLLIPREGFFITPIIVSINLLLFLLMVFAGLGLVSFDAADLIAWGANYKPATTNGQWWRLVTSIFLHGGLMHVLANMYGLIFAGILLEPRMGRARFAGVYLATGILASMTSLWWHDATVSVGASGAIFGLYGALLALILTRAYPKEFGKAFLASILVFVGFNLFMGLQGSIDNAAHLGGLISGFAIGLLLSRSIKQQAAVS
jgi:membrane associated rhomboid family serine protease